MLYVISYSPFYTIFFCDILHLYNIVIPIISSKFCKPEKG